MFQYAFLYTFAKDAGIDPYFQDEFWFRKYADEIRALYSEGISNQIEKIAIHVRRGDYLLAHQNKFHLNLCETDYYERAIKSFDPSDQFLVFSDDIDWCKEKWGHNPRFTFSEGKTELEDMNLMAACKGHIIANSTFSWWGAFLSPLYPYNVVVAPDRWFVDGIRRTLCPKHWKQI